MREYINLGQIEAIDVLPALMRNRYYISHHAVTTKFREVFNASSKTNNGASLNDTQLCEPQLQANLADYSIDFGGIQ